MPITDRTAAFPTSLNRKKLLLFTFLSIITLAPLTMVHAQWITGPLVNTMLILTCALVGPTEALILGLFPSVVALSSGLLPLPLAPAVPFIMIGNAVYVASFRYLKNRNLIVGVLTGSAFKFVFIALASNLIVSHLVSDAALPVLSVIMGVMQLMTALVGGGIALALLRLLPSHD